MGQKPIYGPKAWLRDKNALALFFVGPQGQTNDRSILLKVQTNKKNFVPVRFPIFVLVQAPGGVSCTSEREKFTLFFYDHMVPGV